MIVKIWDVIEGPISEEYPDEALMVQLHGMQNRGRWCHGRR